MSAFRECRGTTAGFCGCCRIRPWEQPLKVRLFPGKAGNTDLRLNKMLCVSQFIDMKIKLSFPKGSDQERPEVVLDVEVVPRKGELLSWDGSTNFIVEEVIHEFIGDNGSDRQVVVWLRG